MAVEPLPEIKATQPESPNPDSPITPVKTEPKVTKKAKVVKFTRDHGNFKQGPDGKLIPLLQEYGDAYTGDTCPNSPPGAKGQEKHDVCEVLPPTPTSLKSGHVLVQCGICHTQFESAELLPVTAN